MLDTQLTKESALSIALETFRQFNGAMLEPAAEQCNSCCMHTAIFQYCGCLMHTLMTMDTIHCLKQDEYVQSESRIAGLHSLPSPGHHLF